MKKYLSILFLLIILPVGLRAQSLSELRFDSYGYLWAGEYKAASLAYDKLIGRSSSPQPEWYFHNGRAYFMQGDLSNAQIQFDLAFSSGYSDACLWQARCYALQGDPQNAISYLNKYLNINTQTNISYIAKDTCFRQLHQSNEWFMLWQKDWGNEETSLINEADYHLRRKDYKRAHSHIEEILKPDKVSGSLYAFNALIYEREGNIHLALNEINYALAKQSENKDFLLQKVDYLILLDEYKDAYSILSSLLTNSPEDFDIRYQRTIIAIKSENFDDAKEDLKLLLKYSQTDDMVFLSGQINYAMGNYIDALRSFNRLLKEDKSNASYFKARGMTYYKTRTFIQAGNDLSMSLDMDPKDPEANYYKGLSENALGDKTMACYYMNRAKKYNYLPAAAFISQNCSK